MTTPHAPSEGHAAPPGLREKLLAATRLEFRGDEIVFDVQDPVFGAPPCKVTGCPRGAHSRGLCNGHHARWAYAGRPDLEHFAATAPPVGHREPVPACQAADCNFATYMRGLCRSHHHAWKRLGVPALPAGIALLTPVATRTAPVDCAVHDCERWAQSSGPWCRRHAHQWRQHGCPPIGDFAQQAHSEEQLPPCERIILADLPPQLRREMQYALQCRRDEAAGKATPTTVSAAIRLLQASGATSTLDLPEERWREFAQAESAMATKAVRLVLYARGRLEDLLTGTGWQVEYPRDVWRLRSLGLSATNATLRFDRMPQPWLRDLAKRWTRWRLSTGTSKSTAGRGVLAVTQLAVFLADHEPDIDRLAAVDRAVLERYLAHLHTTLDSDHYLASHLSALNTFFTAIRRHGWDASLPTGAMFFTTDYPKRSDPLPRALAEHVMAQVEDPANLRRWHHPAHELVTVILMRCGLRLSDALKLRFECIVHDSEGASYLKYFNHKMKREALVPIDEQLDKMIRDQQKELLARWPQGTPVLFPRRMRNVDGTRPISHSTYRMGLRRWLAACEVRSEHGQPVHLTPHQWRHTLATRLINRDVPQEVVRRILDHDSPAMTAHYARLHDSTIRTHWEKARKVNISGQDVVLDPAGPLAEASWAKHRLSRATQALPNGYCGLPVQQSCPHANACLTCPMFMTTAEFLPQHRRQRSEVLQIISAAEARGQRRLAEMNQTVLINLDTVIASLESDGAHDGRQSDAG
ncbi:site-specific integrase [Kitasatospora sp. NPDC096128]|uniref:tyrosine-type recombinase/integrase n=1 Tax=Kitasatospora sp. NPDC096128 TaxID=3155547 RepID=UPI003331328B